MSRARQSLEIRSFRASRKNAKRSLSGIIIDKKSIGTIIINGIPYTYNAALKYDGTSDVMIDQIIEDYEKTQRKKKKKKIRVRRK